MNINQKLKNEMEQFDEIKNMNKVIKNLYQKIAQLEIENKKNSEQFYTLIEYLKMTKEVEANLYQRTDLTREKCKRWLHLICNRKRIEIQDSINSLIIPSNPDWAKERVITRLYHASEPEKDTLETTQLDFITEYHPDIENMIFKEIKKFIKIQQMSELDFINAILFFLQQEINKETNPKTLEYLINTKYKIIFTYIPIEEKMIPEKFNIKPQAIIFQTKLEADISNINPDDFDNFLELFGLNMYSNQMENLLNTDHLTWLNPDDKSHTIISRKCIIRASLLFLDERRLEKINFQLQRFLKLHPSKYEKEVISCFQNNKNDKKHVLSIGIR